MASNSVATTLSTNPIIYTLLLLVIILFTQSGFAENILYSGENLNTEEYLEYGSYVFKMQSDCNLVLYDNGYPIWASNTGGTGSNCYCAMQSDGNLVVYDPNGTPLWASNTGGPPGYFVLILQKDRNVVIYGSATWATATNAVNGKNGRPGISVIKVERRNEYNGTTKAFSSV